MGIAIETGKILQELTYGEPWDLKDFGINPPQITSADRTTPNPMQEFKYDPTHTKR